MLALALGLLTALAVACGDDGGDDRRLIAPTRAADIQEELDTIASRVERGRCLELPPAFKRLNDAIDGLPRATDRRLRRRLAQGAENLEQIAADECRGNRPKTTKTAETEPETVPETVPETTTVPPETQTPTQTTPPQTQTTPPPTQPPAPVPEDPTGGEPAPESFEPPGQAKKEKGRG
jgi:hypothetical protein